MSNNRALLVLCALGFLWASSSLVLAQGAPCSPGASGVSGIDATINRAKGVPDKKRRDTLLAARRAMPESSAIGCGRTYGSAQATYQSSLFRVYLGDKKSTFNGNLRGSKDLVRRPK
jgi:hypothetical protein